MNAIMKLLESLYTYTKIPVFGTMLDTLRKADSKKASVQSTIRNHKDQLRAINKDAKDVMPGQHRKSS